MLEIFILLATCLLAKKGRTGRRRYTGYFFPRVSSTLALSTLATNDMLIGAVLGAVDAPTWISKIRATWTISNITQGDGPIIVGLAHSDYSAAEVEEWFEATSAWQTNNKIAAEQAARKCRMVGALQSDAAGDNTTWSLNDGKPITTKLGFAVNATQGLIFWAFNDGNAVLITGSSIHLNGVVTCRRM